MRDLSVYRSDVFENELQSAYEADRIGYVVQELQNATQSLVSLDIFDSVDVELDARMFMSSVILGGC